MIRTASAVVVLALGLMLTGCGHKDAGQCDFYKSLGVNWVHMQGYVPSDVQDQIDKFC